jgi:hypothetical protein
VRAKPHKLKGFIVRLAIDQHEVDQALRGGSAMEPP